MDKDPNNPDLYNYTVTARNFSPQPSEAVKAVLSLDSRMIIQDSRPEAKQVWISEAGQTQATISFGTLRPDQSLSMQLLVLHRPETTGQVVIWAKGSWNDLNGSHQRDSNVVKLNL